MKINLDAVKVENGKSSLKPKEFFRTGRFTSRNHSVSDLQQKKTGDNNIEVNSERSNKN